MPERFPKFMLLPPELREMIWQFSLAPRIVELLPSNYFRTSFYSPTPLPPALSVSQDSRNAVRKLYAECFGWLWPGRVLFNFEIDTLYLDSSAVKPLCVFLKGILKENELERLRCVAFDASLLVEDGFGMGVKRAIGAMSELRVIRIVRSIGDVILPRGGLNIFEADGQIVFLDERGSKRRAYLLNWTWEERTEETPDGRIKLYKSWAALSEKVEVEVEVVYGWRSGFLEEGGFNCDDFTQWDVGVSGASNNGCAWETDGLQPFSMD